MIITARRSAAPRGIRSTHAPAFNLPARFMALGMFGFLIVAALAPWAAPLLLHKGLGFLGGMSAHLLAAHVTLMVAGWVAVLLAGVAYRLVGMFTLAEDALWQPGAWLELVLSTAGAWDLAAVFLFGLDGWARLTGGLLLLAGGGCI